MVLLAHLHQSSAANFVSPCFYASKLLFRGMLFGVSESKFPSSRINFEASRLAGPHKQLGIYG